MIHSSGWIGARAIDRLLYPENGSTSSPSHPKMAKNLFSVPIFFIVFRETLEAAIIVSVLLGLVEQLVFDENKTTPTPTTGTAAVEASDADSKHGSVSQSPPASGLVEDDTIQRRRLLRKMRLQVWLGGEREASTVVLTTPIDFPWSWFRTTRRPRNWSRVSLSTSSR